MSPLSGFVLVVLLVAASCLSVQDSRRRTIRGFRVGAADRFSHGFGKRAEPLEDALAQRLGYVVVVYFHFRFVQNSKARESNGLKTHCTG